MKICIIGAGISGLCAGVKLKTKLNINDFTIFESNEEVGGVWLTHTYPKCSCDVAANLYSYSFEKNPEWSSQFVPQKELLAYLQGVAKKYELYSNIKFNHRIQKLTWNESTRKWEVVVWNKKEDVEEEFVFDVILSAQGGWQVPNVPEIFSNFEGPVMHSSKWDESVDLKGKVVGVIGSGASAVQLIPAIVDQVKELYSFQRRPAWIFPRPQFKFPKPIQKVFKALPITQKAYRSGIFLVHEVGFEGFKNESIMHTLFEWVSKAQLLRQIPRDKELRKKLTPDYPFGCKRPVPSEKFFPALKKKNVQVIRDPISGVKGHYILMEDGTEHKIDVLILATGYNLHDSSQDMKINGTGSENVMASMQSEGLQHYRGTITHSAPNFFIIFGPGSGVLYTSNVFQIECQNNWIIKVLREMITKEYGVVKVSKSVQEEYMKKGKKLLENKVYGGSYSCGSYLANKEGVAGLIHYDRALDYWRMMRKAKLSNLEFSS